MSPIKAKGQPAQARMTQAGIPTEATAVHNLDTGLVCCPDCASPSPALEKRACVCFRSLHICEATLISRLPLRGQQEHCCIYMCSCLVTKPLAVLMLYHAYEKTTLLLVLKALGGECAVAVVTRASGDME
jgi:hypothetical protein